MNSETIEEYQRQYRLANRDKMIEHNRNYYKENKEKLAEYHRKYRQAHQAKLLQYQKERKLSFDAGGFDKRLKYLMSLRNVNQTELGQIIGVSRQAVSEYMFGRMLPSLRVLIKISKHLNASLDYLVFGEPVVS